MKSIARMVTLLGLVMVVVTPVPASAGDLDGSYQLTKRVLADGTEIPWGDDLMGFMTLVDGWRSFHVTWMDGDHRDSTSLIAKYTLTDTEFCEDIQYWFRNNMGTEGVSYQPPEETKECAPVSMENGHPSFPLPGEPVVVSFGDDGFTATAEGVFKDYWQKVD